MASAPRPIRLAVLAAVLTLGACATSDDEIADDTEVTAPSTPATSAPPTTGSPVTTEAPATTASPATTEAPATTETPTTTEAPTTTAPAGSTTTAAPTTTAPGATTTTVVPADLVLDGTGLGVVEFGDPADAVVASLTKVLGEPTEDTGWVDPFEIGTCASDELRRVSWDSLNVTFGDNGTPGSRQFFTYSYGDVTGIVPEPAGLLTTTGIGVGASVADLRAAYPDVEIVAGEEGLIETSWLVDEDPDPAVVQTVGGLLTGDTDTDVVTVIYGGSFCG